MASTCIIILNWNGYDDTRRCILSLDACADHSLFDIMIIDNGSLNDEGAKLKCEFRHIHLISNHVNLGFAAAVNQGISHAEDVGYRYVLILNNDVEAKRDFFKPLCRTITSDNRTVAMPIILQEDSDRIQNVGATLSFFLGLGIHIGKGKPYQTTKVPAKVDYLPFVCVAAPVEAFHEVGLLDENYFAYYEDADWCLRAKKLGWNLEVVPDSQVWHKVSGATSEDGKMGRLKAYLMSRNYIYFARKHYSLPKRLILYAANFHSRMAWGLQKSCSSSARLAWLKGMCDGFTGNMSKEFLKNL